MSAGHPRDNTCLTSRTGRKGTRGTETSSLGHPRDVPRVPRVNPRDKDTMISDEGGRSKFFVDKILSKNYFFVFLIYSARSADLKINTF